ncbi:MAG: ATP-binding protein [Proteobacteria bacterium]|nr:ATP-binding protein [Pseudomonadota bacterium]
MTAIRTRLLVGAGLGVAIAFVVSGGLVYTFTRASVTAQFDQALEAKARSLAAFVELDGDTVEAELDPAGPLGDRDDFEIWSRDRVLVRSTSLGTADLVPSPGTRPILASDSPGTIVARALRDGRAGRQITLRFLPRVEPGQAHRDLPEVVLVLARGTADVDATIGRIAAVLVGVGAFGTLLALAILALAIRLGLAPLRALATSITAIQPGALATRLPPAHVPLEVAPVVARLDELLGRLAFAFERERELTAELAHELRTPLAGIRATIEVALDRDRPTERYRTALTDVLAIAGQTERLVETMLSLARLDAGPSSSSSSSSSSVIAVDALIREVVEPWAQALTARGVELDTCLPAVTITCDREKLRLVLGNLVENAVTYVDDAGRIAIALAADRIEITNTGCTLPAGSEVRVFERFWRGDAARSTGHHAGLGLALCKKLVDVIGGTVDAAIAEGTFTITVRFA